MAIIEETIIEEVGVAERGSDSEAAFAEWYTEQQGPLQSYCRAMLRDEATAADVAQEALLRAWSRGSEFESAVHRRRWVWRVAHNLCVDTLRARRRAVPTGLLFDREAAGNDQDAMLEREFDGRCVRAAFGTLQPRHQELLYLRDVVGVDYEELVTLVGGTRGSVRAGVFRARRSLRARMSREVRVTRE